MEACNRRWRSGSGRTRRPGFRPRYELAVSYGGVEFFRHTSVFILAFAVKDEAAFDQLWSDQGLRKVFTERQIQRTMWPTGSRFLTVRHVWESQGLSSRGSCGSRPQGHRHVTWA